MITTHSVSLTDIGRKRENNEDSCLADDAMGLYIVADGMGGHEGGDVASKIAIERAAAHIRLDQDVADQDPQRDIEPKRLIEEAIQLACEAVYREGTMNPELRGMGTTMTLLLFDEDRAYLGHVGDSRAYQIRGGAAYQLSMDHTLAAELLRGGGLTPQEAARSHLAHILTKNLGQHASVAVDVVEIAVAEGDAFVLSSDGLNPAAAEPSFANIVTEHDLEDVPGELIELGKSRGSTDNLTAIVVRCTGEGAADARVFDTLRKLPPFERISALGLHHLCDAGRLRELDPGEVLFEPGQPVELLVGVLQGRLSWQGSDADAVAVPAPAVVGLSTLLGPRTPPRRLVATEPSVVFALTGDEFQGLARRRPGLGVALLRAVGADLTESLESTGIADLHAF